MKTLRFLSSLVILVIICFICNSCSKEEEPVIPSISVTTDKITIEQSGGAATINFNTNTTWMASCSASWVTVSPANGVSGSATLNLTVKDNDSYDERNATITITAGNVSKNITLTQKQKDALTVTSNKVEVKANGGEAKIEVKANIDYKVEVDESCKEWIKIVSTRAMSTYYVTLDVAPNDELKVREGKIDIISNASKETIHIYQEAGKPSIVLTQKEYMVSSDGETIKVELKSNTNYTLQMPAGVNWVKENSTRAMSSYTHYFTVDSNNTYDARTAHIIFKNDEQNLKDTVTITQAQKNAIIISQKNYEVGEEGGIITVQLNTNEEFTISSSDEWISENSTRALTEYKKSFKVDSLPSDVESRTGHVLFTTESGLQDSITVTQEKPKNATKLELSFYGTLWGFVGSSYEFFVKPTPANAKLDCEWTSSNPDILEVTGNGKNAQVKYLKFGNETVKVKDKISGLTAEYTFNSMVSGFNWKSTGNTYYGLYPKLTIEVGEEYKLEYTSNQGSDIKNLFAKTSSWIYYEGNGSSNQPTVFSITPDGVIKGLKPGTCGIKGTGYVQRLSGGNERIYIEVIEPSPYYYEKEYNNDFATATPIKSDKPTQFQLSSTSDVDVFKFNTTDNSFNFQIEYLGSSSYRDWLKSIRYELYNANYVLCGSGAITVKGSGETYTAQHWDYIGNSGTYYIRFLFNQSDRRYFPDGKINLTYKTKNESFY